MALYRLSFTIELIALLASLGLGIFLVTRSSHRLEAWLAALTTWSMSGLFLNMLLSLSPPPIPAWLGFLLLFWPKGILQQQPEAWLHGWTSTLAPVFWYHGSLLMRNRPLGQRHRVFLVCAYLVGALAMVIQAIMPERYNTISGDPLYLNTLRPGPVYALSLGGLVLLCILSIRNLIIAARAEPRPLLRRQLNILMAATLLAGASGPIGLVAAFMEVPVPMFLVALFIGAGVLATSLGVARYSALMENRIFQRDFYMSFLSISIVAVIYLISTWIISLLHPFPPFVYILSGGAAVTSHSLVEFVRLRTDLFLNTREKRLRRGLLRYQNGYVGQEPHLGLARLLESICAPVQASFAILFVRQNEHFEVQAAYRWSQTEVLLPIGALQVDDVRQLRRGELPSPFEMARLLLPIYRADHQVGALLLGPAEHGLAYSPVDLGSLEDFSDYLGLWLGQAGLPEGQDEPSSVPDMPPTPEDFMPSADQISSREVELGLRHLHDYANLAEMPLARLGCVTARTGRTGSHIETGKAVQAALREAMEKLRPPGESPDKRSHAPVPREWYPYIILHYAYIDSTPNREIMDRLYISEGTFNRTRRSAIRSLTMLLGEMESQLQNN